MFSAIQSLAPCPVSKKDLAFPNTKSQSDSKTILQIMSWKEESTVPRIYKISSKGCPTNKLHQTNIFPHLLAFCLGSLSTSHLLIKINGTTKYYNTVA
jgi:hypothetical protein